MKRYVITALLLAAFGTCAAAQAPPPTVVPPPAVVTPPGGPLPPPPYIVGPPVANAPFVWPNGFYKSGGVLVGADGNYPYDSGMYLLGGTDIARVTGYFRMVYPPPTP